MKLRLIRVALAAMTACVLLPGFSSALISGAPPKDHLSGSLSEMLEHALSSNPQVLLAKAKLLQVEAELKDVRLRVTQEVLEAFNDRKRKRREMETVVRRLDRTQALVDKGNMPQGELYDLQLQIANAEADIANVEGRLRYLVGAELILRNEKKTTAKTDVNSANRSRPQGRPSVPQKFQAALTSKVTAIFDDMPLDKVASFFQNATGVSFTLATVPIENEYGEIDGIRMGLSLQDTELKGALLAITDLYDLVFVFRDYGILVTTHSHAYSLDGATIPSSVTLAGTTAGGGSR